MVRCAVVLALTLAAACAESACPLEGRPGDPEVPNVLVVIIDDVGIDLYAPWAASSDPVLAPTMDCLCRTGLRFDTVWASPFCTPARAALLTGRHPRRFGIGRYVSVTESTWELPLTQRTIAEALAEEGYATAFFGKWHLAGRDSPTGADHPNAQGFEHFSGTLGNIKRPIGADEPASYSAWAHLENGGFSARDGYLTSATVDDAVEHVADLPEPWFVVVSFNAAHAPHHEPPARLVNTPLPRDADATAQLRAMVEAADTELGRLLEELDRDVLARTQIWTMSDNGTAEAGRPADQPANRHKGTLYEAGVRVPLVVSGASVPSRGEVSEALVSILDVFPTVVEQAGGALDVVDGASLRALLEDPSTDHHEVLYADVTSRDGEVRRAVRDRTHKLVQREDGARQTWRIRHGLEEEPVDYDSPTLARAMERFVETYMPEGTESTSE